MHKLATRWCNTSKTLFVYFPDHANALKNGHYCDQDNHKISWILGDRHLVVKFWTKRLTYPYTYFLYLGEIKAASGDVDVQRFIEQELRIEGQFGSYPNLIEGLIKNPGNVQTLEDLTTKNSAVVGLEFSTLRDFFPSIEVREFYDETFAAQSALWGANM